jgi:hypothetical protein
MCGIFYGAVSVNCFGPLRIRDTLIYVMNYLNILSKHAVSDLIWLNDRDRVFLFSITSRPVWGLPIQRIKRVEREVVNFHL